MPDGARSEEPALQTSRRRFMAYFAGAGLAGTVLPGSLWAAWQQSEEPKVTTAMLSQAEKLAGLEFTAQERELMIEDLNDTLEDIQGLREIDLPNAVPPALHFDPRLPGMHFDKTRRPMRPSAGSARALPADREEIAFWPVTDLARLIRDRKISSVELTTLYLDRLKRFDPKLQCVITLTEELALRQARRADEELARGVYRGPLHGIPWGAKDLLSTRDYPTTWGAMPYKDQVIDEDATVVSRLENAGAVLVAKLTLGALAWGDVWYGGTTKNPWNLEQGSSGSSAGPASAIAAGLVGFAIGSETLGSIVSPSTRCGVTGLRPTFGRVSRHGAMALSWSMDKLGPMARSVEDCALVLDAVLGPDGHDPTVSDLPFNWDAGLDVSRLRVGYLKSAFENGRGSEAMKANDQKALADLRGLGIDLIPIDLPDFPVGSLSFILNTEAAAAFDDLTRSNRDDAMVRQIRRAWPNAFRASRLVPAVEYIQANRARTVLMGLMDEALADIDVYVAPSFSGNLLVTNLTGHPAIALPNGFSDEGSPTSITFSAPLYAEDKLCALAKAYQDATDH
ncbi:MAG TPA: amidase, partial [Acidobacteriota bacterium]|nr:amidase [Acidobacteriota bacterium]